MRRAQHAAGPPPATRDRRSPAPLHAHARSGAGRTRSRGALRALALLGLLSACGRDAHRGTGTLYAALSWPPHDSARIALPVEAHRCGRDAGLLIQAVEGGNGVLIWARPGRGVVGGIYPLLMRGDSATPRGAMVSVRFMTGEVARGLALDSGVVTLGSAGDRISAHARGSGLDYAAGQRVAVDLSVESAPMARDTVNCQVKL